LPDAVVIGAGHNGLVCAAYLARAGLEVVVCERSDRIGGACVTEEIAPGFRVSTAAHSLSLLQPEIVSELGLDLDVRLRDPHVFLPLEEGSGVLLWDDDRRRAEEIARVSRSDAEGYPRLVETFEEAARRLRPLCSFPATRRQVRRALGRDLFEATVEASIAEVCEEHLDSDVLQGFVASQGVLGSTAGPRTPGTACIYLHHALGSVTGRAGAWGFVRGGMGAVSDGLAASVRAHGGEIRLEAEVAGVPLEGGRRAGGVELEATGEVIEAAIVCSGADPRRTVGFVAPEALAPEFVEDVALLPAEGTVVKVNCGLSGLPRFRGMGGGGLEPGPEHLGTILVAPSVAYLEDACGAAAEGRPSPGMYCEAWIQSAHEPGLAPEGRHTLSAFAQWAPYELAEGTWEERREEIGDLVVGALARFAPGIEDLVEHRMVLGPPDLEERFGLSGGHPFHGEMLPDWMWDARPAGGWHRHRTPLAGLYMCGAGTHPGGGVCGAPGRNAARAVLEDLVAAGSRLPGS
jgi:phytoene dehydrogenase-like protein